MAQASVIVAVFAIAVVGVVAFAQRGEAGSAPGASAAAIALGGESVEPSAQPTSSVAPVAAPDAAGPGTYTVQPGDSLFSVAADLGISANELVYWNKETFPRILNTPALQAGWVLATTGPPLPTPTPKPEPTPRPIAAATPPPQAAGLPSFGPSSFPASARVSVGYYSVSGSTPSEIFSSMEANGPYSEWLGRNAQAHVETQPTFNFTFRGDQSGGCDVVPTGGGDFVTLNYHVVLPVWDPPPGASSTTIDWWLETIDQTVAHEGHHITLYEAYRPQLNQVVRSGDCAWIEDELVRLFGEAARVNCEFDLLEYGYELGLTLESCLAH